MIATPELLTQRASERTGLSNFGPSGWRTGLEHLVGAVGENIGHDEDAVAKIEELIVGRLTKRLRIEAWYGDHADEATAPVEQLAVIVGMPRTATTALHYLLAVDPAFRYLRRWEVADPVPPPDIVTEADDPRRPTEPGAPDVQHIRTVDGPVEDGAIHEMCFHNAETILPLPSYTAWWRAADHTALFPYHERVLRLLHSRRPPRAWLLKSPAYLFELTELAKHYPTARFIMTHRDPVEVLPSACSTILTSRLKRLPTWTSDLDRFGREVQEHWVAGVQRATAARAVIGEDRFLDIAQRSVETDPIGAAERIYDFLGARLSGDVRNAMERWATTNQRGSRGEHQYRATDFGLTPDGIRHAFSIYLERFGAYCEPGR